VSAQPPASTSEEQSGRQESVQTSGQGGDAEAGPSEVPEADDLQAVPPAEVSGSCEPQADGTYRDCRP
jgi:hypothetical protein